MKRHSLIVRTSSGRLEAAIVRHVSALSRIPRSACALLALLLLLVTPAVLRSQVDDEPRYPTNLPPLYRTGNGWLGIARDGEIIRIIRFDTALREQAQTTWGNFNPRDVAVPSSTSDSAAILLAAPGGFASLYLISLQGPPDLRPLWQERRPPLREIVLVDELTGDGMPEIVCWGDSGVVSVGLDGIVRFVHSGTIIDVAYHGGQRLYCLELLGSDLVFVTLSIGSGETIARQILPAGGTARFGLCGDSLARDRLAVVASVPPTALLFDLRRGTFVEQFPLDSYPTALLPASVSPGFQLLYSEYPEPVVVPPDDQSKRHALYYPLSDVVTDAATAGNYVLLFGSDSAAIYTRELDYLDAVRATPGEHPRLYVLDSAASLYVLATDRGSTVVEIHPAGLPWLRRNWLLVVGFALLMVTIGVGLFALRRYRFNQTIYANLTQAPGSAGIVILNRRGRVRFINGTARRLFGVDPLVPTDRHVTFYLSRDEQGPVLDAARKVVTEGESFELEHRVEIRGELRTLAVRGRAMTGRYGGASGFIILAEDITASLERDRLVNWASVAHHIAHEMKTPLGTVRASAETLRDRLTEDPEPEDLLPVTQRIIRQSVRLREIVDDLLTVARTESLNLVEADLALIVSSLVDDVSEYLPPNVTLRQETRGRNFRMQVDVDQLTIALRNLVVNARQAIGDRPDGDIRLTLEADDEEIRVVVADNGIGMGRETLARLFQPYYTEKEGGSGIGSVIVRRVVEGHGGTIGVTSALGVGTTFTLRFPVKREENLPGGR